MWYTLYIILSIYSRLAGPVLLRLLILNGLYLSNITVKQAEMYGDIILLILCVGNI